MLRKHANVGCRVVRTYRRQTRKLFGPNDLPTQNRYPTALQRLGFLSPVHVFTITGRLLFSWNTVVAQGSYADSDGDVQERATPFYGSEKVFNRILW